MDIPKTSLADINTTLIKTDSLQNPVIEVLNKLQQSGLFRALVIETNGNKVLLDTAFGQVKAVATEKITKGDEILARIQPGKATPTIKIEQHQTTSQALPQKIVNQLIKLANSVSKPVTSPSTNPTTATSLTEASVLPQVIKVLTHTTNKTLLQINQKNYTIPRQPLLEKGETLLLKPSANNKVELVKIHPEAILKNALSNLLPRVAQSRNTTEISNLQKLISSVLTLKPDNKITTQTPVNKHKANSQPIVNKVEYKQDKGLAENKPNIQHSTEKNINDKVLLTQPVNYQKDSPVKLIKQLLTNLSQPVASAESFKADSLQKIFILLSLVKPTSSTSTGKPLFSIPENMSALHAAIKNSPENFTLLLRQIIQSNAGNNKNNLSDNVFSELSNTLKSDLLQQLEQTISQLQTQKTSIRLNQELNQPIQINLNIPLQLNEQTTALKLKIKQRNSSENSKEKHWEINLAFEFALLGLISTNILLQDTKLSAHFWAVKSTTKQLIDTHLNQFKKQLKKSGFELGLFDCFIGKPATQEESSQAVAESLVDIKV